MRRREFVACVAVAVSLAVVAANTCQVRAEWYNVPGTFVQCVGCGYGGGYHAPLVIGPPKVGECFIPNERCLLHSPSPYACCYQTGQDFEGASKMSGAVPAGTRGSGAEQLPMPRSVMPVAPTPAPVPVPPPPPSPAVPVAPEPVAPPVPVSPEPVPPAAAVPSNNGATSAVPMPADVPMPSAGPSSSEGAQPTSPEAPATSPEPVPPTAPEQAAPEPPAPSEQGSAEAPVPSSATYPIFDAPVQL